MGARVDSVYTRMTGISGTPLRDGYHFGQTIINDYGRPYWTGFNDITGVSAEAEAGPVAFQSPGRIPTCARHAVLFSAGAGRRSARPISLPRCQMERPQVNQFQLLNSTVSLNINNVQFTFGEQSQWLGPGESGSFLMSNNAPPFPMVQDRRCLSRTISPGFPEYSGLSAQNSSSANSPDIIGKLVPCRRAKRIPATPPWWVLILFRSPSSKAEKISFQPTPNFEFGMGYHRDVWRPWPAGNFRQFLSHFLHPLPTAANNPGKRISAADFTYRIPGLRNWLTFTLDSLVVDEFSPIGSTRANVNPGIYMPRIPKIPKLEFRAEGINVSRTTEFAPGFVYADDRRFLGGYTNEVSYGELDRQGGSGWAGLVDILFLPATKFSSAIDYKGSRPI